MVRMDKSAQFYIFAALLLSVLLFSIYSSSKSILAYSKGYDEFSSNYLDEAPNVINHAIYQNLSVFDEFEEYTTSFIKYSKTRNTDFKVLYMLIYEDDLKIVNYLNKDVNVSGEEELLKSTGILFIDKKNNITINYDGTEYDFLFNNESVQFKALILQG